MDVVVLFILWFFIIDDNDRWGCLKKIWILILLKAVFSYFVVYVPNQKIKLVNYVDEI